MSEISCSSWDWRCALSSTRIFLEEHFSYIGNHDWDFHAQGFKHQSASLLLWSKVITIFINITKIYDFVTYHDYFSVLFSTSLCTRFPPVRPFLALISVPTGFHDWGLVTRWAQLLITSLTATYPPQTTFRCLNVWRTTLSSEGECHQHNSQPVH